MQAFLIYISQYSQIRWAMVAHHSISMKSPHICIQTFPTGAPEVEAEAAPPAQVQVGADGVGIALDTTQI